MSLALLVLKIWALKAYKSCKVMVESNLGDESTQKKMGRMQRQIEPKKLYLPLHSPHFLPSYNKKANNADGHCSPRSHSAPLTEKKTTDLDF
ncbi:hypothetical protein AVEN_83584-1 [Araneus ventricosus]|uniref:Uncharacterized protein n=1 Tax=Araneus ventricosus TaxID=182803 RepID=A0A4Y2QJQ5_ARAVE|nr:hypothetical protein AVEN_130553-1 [Araneus ventricosus]GBN63597.1 hypothetical protein AVEN_129342-1 [Araneus ventricosus]GBN64365.1 hypothetical protein AVEN_76920-1 [Araneus ventricosus]GBN64426.1 hypothetical protein AVEN_83584-1 [Araneus ventricosus]